MSNGRINDSKDLFVWQYAMELARIVYVLADRLPHNERNRLADQLRRAVGSIGANIAEGNARRYRRDYIRYLKTAYSSCKEVEHHLLMAEHVRLLHREDVADALALAARIARMLNALVRRLNEPRA